MFVNDFIFSKLILLLIPDGLDVAWHRIADEYIGENVQCDVQFRLQDNDEAK